MAWEASVSDTMAFIERETTYGMGCGLIDLILLSSTLITPGATLWTLDGSLHWLRVLVWPIAARCIK